MFYDEFVLHSSLDVVRLVLVAAGAFATVSCGGSGSPSPTTPSPVPGATTVRGTERLEWSQIGELSDLQFRAYIDNTPVGLASFTCDGNQPARCSAPLPSLTDGTHSIQLAAVSSLSGLESDRSESVVVQKVSTRSLTAAALPDAGRALGIRATVEVVGGASFHADVVARGVAGPVQMTAAPDTRLFVADANGLVRVVNPLLLRIPTVAFDTATIQRGRMRGTPSIAAHPDFERTQWIYLAFIESGANDDLSLLLVRLRDVGGILGEPATIHVSRLARVAQTDSSTGPLLAFGPDGLLYVQLPSGLEFNDEPAASRPQSSFLRLTDAGAPPDIGRMPDIEALPLGFGWHPVTRELLTLSLVGPASAALAPAGASDTSGALSYARLELMRNEVSSAPGALTVQSLGLTSDDAAKIVAAMVADPTPRAFRLSMPISLTGYAGLTGRVTDVVSGPRGTLFLAMGDDLPDADGKVVVLRLTPAR
ncbi:MAG: sorbosone dehydrogenase family protein [Vicinamibacterales bacterium]